MATRPDTIPCPPPSFDEEAPTDPYIDYGLVAADIISLAEVDAVFSEDAA